jgi:hypothetical protein
MAPEILPSDRGEVWSYPLGKAGDYEFAYQVGFEGGKVAWSSFSEVLVRDAADADVG